jgi:hypothetical protein
MTGPQADWLRSHKPYTPTSTRPPGGHVYARRGILHEDGTFDLDAPGKNRRITQGCFEVGVLEEAQNLERR